MTVSRHHKVFPPGDLSWQQQDEKPPACRVDPTWNPAIRNAWHRQFDAVGPRKIPEHEWKRIREAVALCNRCPILTACRAYAQDPSHRAEGVWGGLYFPAGQKADPATGLRRGMAPPPPKGTRGHGRRRRVEDQPVVTAT